MTRADDIRALAEAEATVAELEDELVAAKQAGEDAEALKLDLRQARRRFRELRSTQGQALAEGDAIASPATVTATAQVQE